MQDIEWISIKDEKPPYYKPVEIQDNDGKVHYGWHRMADEHGEFYGSKDTDRIIENVAKWRPMLENPNK